MAAYEDLKELFRAEIGSVHTEVRALREDTNELKQSVRDSQHQVVRRSEEIEARVGSIEKELSAFNRERKLVLGGLAVAFTAAAKGFFDWIVK